jgi:hypothetical protein
MKKKVHFKFLTRKPTKLSRLLVVLVLGLALMVPQLAIAKIIAFEDDSGFNPLNQQTASNPANAAFDDSWWSWPWDNSVAAGVDCTNGGNANVVPLGPYTSTVNSGNYYYAADGCLTAAIINLNTVRMTLSGTFTVSDIITQPTAKGVSMGVSSSAPTTISIYDPSHNLLGTQVVPANLSSSPNTSKLTVVTLTAPNISTVTVSGTPYSNCTPANDISAPFTTQCIIIDDLTVYDQALSITATAGSGQSINTNTVLGTPLKATVKDNNGLAVQGAVVTFTAPNSGASGTFAGGSPTITATTDANGIATAPTFTTNNTGGNYTVTASLLGGANVATFSLTNVVTGYTYYLPFLANNANGYTSYLAIQNGGPATATLKLQYYTPQGSTLSIDSTCPTLNVHAECIPNNPFGAGSKGAAVLISSQPLAIIVAEATPYGGSAYSVGQGGYNSLVVPLAFRNTYGDYSTQLTIFNGDSASVSASVTFYDSNGIVQTAAAQNLTIPALSSTTLDQAAANSNLPNGFNGWAQINSIGGSKLVAQVLEQSASQKFVAIANAQAQPHTQQFAPAIFNGAFNFTTGANIINPTSQPITINVTYHDDMGNSFPAAPFTLAPNALQPIYQGATSGIGLPSGGLSKNFSGAAEVDASGLIVMVVNENGGVSASGASLSGVYATIDPISALGSVTLPVVANGGFGYITGVTIFNTSSSPASGTITYYDTTGTQVGQTQTFNIGSYASQLAYQGAPNVLPSGFYGTAVISQTSGGGGGYGLIATTNALSSLFYTYTEPNQ